MASIAQSSHNPSSNPPTNTHTQDVTNTSTSQTHPVTNGVIPPPLPPPPQQQPTSAVVIPPSPIDQPQLISTNAPAPPPHKQHQQQHESTPASAQSSSKKPSTEQFKPMTNEAATNIKIQMERKQAEIKAKMDKEEAEYKAKMEKEKAEYKAKMQALQQEQENCEKAMIKTVIDEQLTMWDADEKNFNSLKVQEDKYDYIKQRHIYYYKFQLALLNGGDGKKEKQALDELYNYLKTTAFKKDEYDAKQNQKGIETSDKSEQEKQKAKRKRGDERPSSPSKHHRSNNTSRPKSSTKTSAQSHATNSTQSPTNSNDSTDSAGATKPVNRQLSKEMTSPSKHKHHHSDTETHEDMKEKQKSYKHSPTAAQHIMEIEAQLATGVSGKELPVRSKFHKNDNIFKIDMRMDPNQSIDDNIQANLQRLTKEKVLLQGPRPALLVPRLQFRLFRDNYGHPLEEIKSFDDFVYNGDVDNTTAVYLLSHDITTTDNQHESATLFIYPTPSPASTSASKKPQFQFAYINITDEKREKMKISSIHSHVQKIFKINCKITYKQHDGQPVNANTKESVTRIINSKKQNRPSSTPESSPQPPSKKIKTDGDGDSDDLGDNDNDDEDDANDDDEDRRFNIRLPHNILKIFNENVEQLNNTNTKNSNYSKENVVGYMFGKVIEEVSDDDEEEKKKCVIAISHLQIGQSIHSSIITTTQQDNLVYVGNICTSHPPRRPFVISQCDNQVKKPYFFTFTLQKDEEKLVYSTFSASNEIMQQYKGGLHGTHKDFQLTEYFKNDKEFGVKFIDNIDIVLFSSQGTVTNSTSSTTTANRLVMQR